MRGRPNPESPGGSPLHGGELLIRKARTLTGQDGRFTLPSERVLSPVRWGGWSAVRLTLECAGYLRLQTNCSASSLLATNAPGGVPVLDVGRITMQRAPEKKRPLGVR